MGQASLLLFGAGLSCEGLKKKMGVVIAEPAVLRLTWSSGKSIVFDSLNAFVAAVCASKARVFACRDYELVTALFVGSVSPHKAVTLFTCVLEQGVESDAVVELPFGGGIVKITKTTTVAELAKGLAVIA